MAAVCYVHAFDQTCVMYTVTQTSIPCFQRRQIRYYFVRCWCQPLAAPVIRNLSEKCFYQSFWCWFGTLLCSENSDSCCYVLLRYLAVPSSHWCMLHWNICRLLWASNRWSSLVCCSCVTSAHLSVWDHRRAPAYPVIVLDIILRMWCIYWIQ